MMRVHVRDVGKGPGIFIFIHITFYDLEVDGRLLKTTSLNPVQSSDSESQLLVSGTI